MFDQSGARPAFAKFQLTCAMYSVKGIAILDGEGQRIASKYFAPDLQLVRDQKNLEKRLRDKTTRQASEVLVVDNLLVLYKPAGDTHVFLIGSQDENELLLLSALNALCDALAIVLHGQVDRRSMQDSLDTVLLVIDELVDEGIVLETDPGLIAQRASMKNADSDSGLSEQTISQALHTARDQIVKALR
eukprot:m51a1_g5719 Coatomer subunit zeta (189) ;mRNA; r:1104376-1105322